MKMFSWFQEALGQPSNGAGRCGFYPKLFVASLFCFVLLFNLQQQPEG